MVKSDLSYNYTQEEVFKKYDSSDIDQPRVTVITQHNSKSYQVDGMTTEFTPLTYFFKQKDGSEICMSKYFWERYQIKLIDKQPLLFVTRRDEGRIYLPT